MWLLPVAVPVGTRLICSDSIRIFDLLESRPLFNPVMPTPNGSPTDSKENCRRQFKHLTRDFASIWRFNVSLIVYAEHDLLYNERSISTPRLL
jgi:hypothetical protein